MSTKTRKLVLLLAGVLCIGLISFFFVRRYQSSFFHLTQWLYDLPATTTAEDLEKQGFVNLTDVQNGPVEKVESYFKIDAYFPQILKTFTETDEGLVVRIFQRHRTARMVSMTTYKVQLQGAVDPGAFYQIQPQLKTGDDGTQEVWLVRLDSSSKQPTGYEQLLYRYQGQ